MSEIQSASDEEVRTTCDLTAFQQTILTVLSENPQYGLAIKRELEEYYGNEVNHGRLYPNLDELVERDLIAKSELDKALTSTNSLMRAITSCWENSIECSRKL